MSGDCQGLDNTGQTSALQNSILSLLLYLKLVKPWMYYENIRQIF